ncbi:MAG: hypothetical protein WC400_02425 [Patescibacteria group bacterium]|jgi:hypothetical protein
MIDQMVKKMQHISGKGITVNEDEVRSFMILVRKSMELMVDKDRASYSTLNLFCNWTAHTKIDQSIAGLRTLATINDVLVQVGGLKGTANVLDPLTQAIGFDQLHSQLLAFLNAEGVANHLDDNGIWATWVDHLIEIISDVPITFPPLSTLSNKARKIYEKIAANPIKPGAGVVSIKLSPVDYDAIGWKGQGILTCLLIRTEDTTTIVCPISRYALGGVV